MSWVIYGTIFQAGLAMFLFMLVAFSAGGIANGNKLSKSQLRILNFSLYFIPATCVVSAIIVFFLYYNGASNNAYWWYTMPIFWTILYLVYTRNMLKW